MANPHERLSPRELQIFHGIAHGMSHKTVGMELGIAQATVQTHVHKIRVKTGLRRDYDIVMYAVRNGMVK